MTLELSGFLNFETFKSLDELRCGEIAVNVCLEAASVLYCFAIAIAIVIALLRPICCQAPGSHRNNDDRNSIISEPLSIPPFSFSISVD